MVSEAKVRCEGRGLVFSLSKEIFLVLDECRAARNNLLAEMIKTAPRKPLKNSCKFLFFSIILTNINFLDDRIQILCFLLGSFESDRETKGVFPKSSVSLTHSVHFSILQSRLRSEVSGFEALP